jgi:hypothetical protein
VTRRRLQVGRAGLDQRHHRATFPPEQLVQARCGLGGHAIVGRQDRHLGPIHLLGLGKRSQQRLRRTLSRERDPGVAMGPDRALDHEADIAGHLLGKLGRRVELPPLNLVHSKLLRRQPVKASSRKSKAAAQLCRSADGS